MEKYFIYCRKSTESEDRQVLSIESQVNEMKALASKLGVQVIEIFNESRTAKEPGRPIFNDMMKRVHKREVQGVLCWKLDRLARNPLDGATVIWALKQNGIKIITPNQTYSHGDDNIILMYIEFGMAQKYVDDLSKNVKRGNKTKLEKGEWLGIAPMGYLNHSDPMSHEKTLIPDKERFPIIRKMWNLMLSGTYSVEKIIDIANNEFRLRTRQTQRQGGKPVSLSFGYQMFSNPFYCGIMKRSEGEFKHKYKKLVTQNEFDRVQEILGRKDRPKPKTRMFAYTGIMHCGDCGCLVTAEEKKKFIKSTKENRFYTYYHCTKRKRELSCSQPSLILPDMKIQIADFLEQIHVPKRFMAWVQEGIEIIRGEDNGTRLVVFQNLEQEYAHVQKSLKALMGMRMRELISDEEFTTEKNRLQAEGNEIRKKLEKEQDYEKYWEESVENIFVFAHHAKMWFKKGNLMTQRKLVEYLGSNWVLKDKKLSVDLFKPFLLIDESLNGIRSKNPTLEPSEYGSVESPYFDIEDEKVLVLRLLRHIRTAILESNHDYTLNVPEFLEKEKGIA